MFKTGDAVIHPIRGAGIVVRVVERQWHGDNNLYYRIKLLGRPGTKLMVPTNAAETLGLRLAIPSTKIKNVWRVLRDDPSTLPDNHKKRYKAVEEKLHTGDVFQVAEAVRDMTWRQQQEGKLTTMGKRMYKEGMNILAGEIAAVQGVAMKDAEDQIRVRLGKYLP